MPEPAFFLQNHLPFAGVQIDVDQAAFRVSEVKRAELAPVGERLPVAFLDFDTHQLRAVRVSHPGTVGHPLLIDLIHHILFQAMEIHAAQFAAFFHVPQGLVILREKTAKGVIPCAVGQLGCLLLIDI